MSRLRIRLQRWIDRETEKIERVKEEVKQVIATLEKAKTIGELRQILEKEGKHE